MLKLTQARGLSSEIFINPTLYSQTLTLSSYPELFQMDNLSVSSGVERFALPFAIPGPNWA
jgi:hypothetical protein